MPSVVSEPTLFPSLTSEGLLSFQFSSWYPHFSSWSIKSTVIRPLNKDFRDYLDAEGVFLPKGSEDQLIESTLSDDEEAEEEEADERNSRFAFPDLDAKIREVIAEYEAVFPKLNFSSPRDAAWMLPASSPLKCVSPADVYLLLKSSDYVLHDIDADQLFQQCDGDTDTPEYELELVLRKWYPVDRSRELRCFVRRENLIAISQRDPNFYDFWNEQATQTKVVDAITKFWQENIRGKWESTSGNYVFDFLLTRDLSRGHIIDFNPYWPHTDPSLFTYEDLLELLRQASSDRDFIPELRVVDSRSHPAAARNAPAHQHNMVPIEALALSQGRSIEEFAGVWQSELGRSTVDASDESD